MKKVLFLLAFFISIGIFSQTAQEIINKNIENSGGLANWKRLNSVIISGKVSLGVKEQYPIIIEQQRPNLTKTSIVIRRKKTTIEGYDGKKGYAMNYASNILEEYGNYKPESFDNDFIDWQKKGFEAKYLGKEKIGNTYCHKVQLTKNVNVTLYYFDTKNYMLIREEKNGELLNYSDYKKVGELLFPFRIERTSLEKVGDYIILVNKVEINKVLPKDTFKFE